jgi:hypothetical protein
MTTPEVTLVDTGCGLKRIELLLQELNSHIEGDTPRETLLRGALFGAISDEVEFLLEEISAKVAIPELTKRR